jgi:ATP-dependent helicase/nuclease subunit B
VVTVTQNELLEALEERGAEVFLLPNARAARGLRGAFDARQRAGGVGTWDAPRVQSWGQWTAALWSELVVSGAETRLLLNAAQERSVWREIVAEDAASTGYGSADALAELAMSGWALAAAYEATGRLRGFAATHDSRVFVEWAEAFTRRCGTKGYVAAAQLDEALLMHVEAGRVEISGAVELVGFGKKTPVQESLSRALRACGVEVRERSLRSEVVGASAAVRAANEGEEVEMVARWLRGFLEERRGRVAVLLPGLAEERAELEDVLREVLTPELQAVGADLSSTPWEFAQGDGLGQTAMVGDMLALARWVEGALPVARVSALLLSPYFGGGDRRDVMARFDAGTLRRELLLRSEIGIEALLAMAEHSAARELLGWLGRVQASVKRDGERGKVRGYAEWMEYVRGLGQAAGWPGERALTAREFAATEAWESSLDTVATLDFSGKRVAYATALEALEQQVAVTMVTMPATDAPVQVMSVAEAEGSVWDAVVFLRATDANWPAVERVHPLLPWAMQRSLTMPGGDGTGATARAREFTAGLLARTGRVAFTSAAEDASGALRWSPLVAELRLEQMSPVEFAPKVEEFSQIAVESVADDEALPGLPSQEVHGGSRVLKLQAACGFLAFAELRLRAKEPVSGDLGLDAGESGSLLHRTMETFWKETVTQDALRAMSRGEREERLKRAIDASLPRRLRAESGWDEAYVAVVKERLCAVLQQWLEVELERGPFTVVAMEREEEVPVGPLMLKVRMDRVDQLASGGSFFVDYKTGYTADPKAWEGAQPDDPQLPLYALQPEAGELQGLAFAKVRAGSGMKWAGYQAEAGILPVSRVKNVRDMGALVEEWRGTLTVLAEDFASGVADVRPKSYEVNCTRCGQRLLCRLDRASLLDADDEDEDEEGLDG